VALRIATWNINSVRLRVNLALRLLKEQEIDILCLQETKCPPGQFPANDFRDAGYPFIASTGRPVITVWQSSRACLFARCRNGNFVERATRVILPFE
jgi:exonuclease III